MIADPLVAKCLKEQGYDTKEKLIDWLYKNTTQTVKDYKNRNWIRFITRGRYRAWSLTPAGTKCPDMNAR